MITKLSGTGWKAFVDPFAVISVSKPTLDLKMVMLYLSNGTTYSWKFATEEDATVAYEEIGQALADACLQQKDADDLRQLSKG
jgi:hypothetical protein